VHGRTASAAFEANDPEPTKGGLAIPQRSEPVTDPRRSVMLRTLARGNGMQFSQLKRREFITLLAGTAAWPRTARAQQSERMRRIGVLSSLAADDQGNNVRLAAFQQRLQQLGWTDGHNVRIDYRFAAGNPENYRKYAAELVALAPDVILAPGGSLAPMLQATRTVPIVFAFAADPVGSGLVESLSRPGGNATGFLLFEYDLSAKWLELLKEIVPGVTRAAVLRDPTSITGIGQFAVIQSVARSVGVEVSPLNLRDAGETEPAVTAFARSSNGGLIVAASALASVQRNLIIELAARHRLPAVYFERLFVASGGLISYGADFVDQYQRAAGYVDRILRGEKPADLPVQAPTKYDLVINLKTAKTLGIEVPQTLVARADEVID
jgi:putative tryptophan/tyrosine transport system substrate-binding protein